jgi:hypothetical protein
LIIAGATAVDAQSGDITDAVLACPPASCLPLGCPGHEFAAKGLQGCGVDTADAPIGTQFTVTFVVMLRGPPVLTANATRTLVVASPCSPGDTYCPEVNTAQQCGSSPCATRAALLAIADAHNPPFYSLQFDSRAPASAIQNATGVLTLSMTAPCGTAPVPLAFCAAAVPGCGVHLTPDIDASDASALRLLSSAPLSPAPTCMAAHITNGTCSGGSHLFQFRALRGTQNASDVAAISINIGHRLVELQVQSTLEWLVGGAVPGATLKDVTSAFNGLSGMLDPALRAAAPRLADNIGSCMGDAGEVLVGFQPAMALRSSADAVHVTSVLDGASHVTTVQVWRRQTIVALVKGETLAAHGLQTALCLCSTAHNLGVHAGARGGGGRVVRVGDAGRSYKCL